MSAIPESIALSLETDDLVGTGNGHGSLPNGKGSKPFEFPPHNTNGVEKQHHAPEYRRSRTLSGLSNRLSRDQGYAWIILVASCCLYNICDGVSFSMGLFFPYFLETFKESAGKTSWIASIMMANTLLTGPLSSYLLHCFGARAVSTFGAILATTGAVISYFATSE